MKKKLLVLIIATFSTFYSYSQFSGSFCIDCYTSFEVGGVSSTISGMENASPKFGVYFGIYQFVYISDTFSFRYGIGYSNTGAEEEVYDAPLIIHSATYPVSLHYTYDYKFQGFAGFELSTNFLGKLPHQEGNDVLDNSFDFRSTITLFDISAFIGVGYIVAERVDFNLKYNLGLTDIYANETSREIWKKNWVSLGVAYTLRF